MPALLFVQAFFEGWHGFSALADFVEELPIGDAAHALGVDEARGRRVIQGGIGAIAFPSFAVALDTFIEIDGAGRGEGRGRRLDRILAELGFFGNFPLPVLINRKDYGNRDRGEEKNEQKFAQAESTSRMGSHGQVEIFAYGDRRQKKEKPNLKRAATLRTRPTHKRVWEKSIGMKLLAAEDQPEKLGVEAENGGGNDPCDDGGKAGVGEFAHFAAVAGELNQRDYGEGQLKAENDLAQYQERSDFALSGDADDHDGGKNGDRTRDEAAQPRLETNLQKSFHDDLPGESSSESGVLAGSEESAGEEGAGQAYTQDGTEKFVGIGNFRNVMQAMGMKGCGAEDENRGVDEESEAESQCGIENGVVHGFAAVANGGTERAGLYNAGMKIEIMRHDRRAEDADGDVKHFAIAKDFGGGDEAHGGFAPNRAGEKDFVRKTASDGGDQRHDESFDEAETTALQGQDDQNIEPGNKYSREKWQAEEEFESHCGAENLREIASGDSDFTNDPKRD